MKRVLVVIFLSFALFSLSLFLSVNSASALTPEEQEIYDHYCEVNGSCPDSVTINPDGTFTVVCNNGATVTVPTCTILGGCPQQSTPGPEESSQEEPTPTE